MEVGEIFDFFVNYFCREETCLGYRIFVSETGFVLFVGESVVWSSQPIFPPM